MAITTQQKTTILKIVVGLYNGGISAENLSALANIIDSGASMLDLANELVKGGVFKDKIMGGKVTVQSQVNVLMNNFGVVADSNPKSAGSESEKFFIDAISSGRGFGSIVEEAVNYLSAPTLPKEFSAVGTLLTNKALVAEIYAERRPVDNFDKMIALLADVTVTSPTTRADAVTFIDNFDANKISLTIATENLTGTNGIEIYSGVFDPTGNATTLSNADVINGANGTDVLNIRVGSTSTGGSTIAPVLSNIENFFITNQATSDPFTMNFANITGEKQIWDKDSVSGAITKVINVDTGTTVGMINTLGSLEANFSGNQGGFSDVFTLILTGAGNARDQVNFNTITTSGSTDNSFEIASIISQGALSNVELGVGQMTLKSIRISGDAALLLSGANDLVGLNTVDASEMTAGGLSLNARGSEETNFIFKGSSAVDFLILKNSTINTASSLDGGVGKDTLGTQNFNNLSAAAVNKAVGFEVLQGIGGAENLDAASFTVINEFLFTETTNGSSSATIRNIENSDRFIYSTDISGGNYALRLEGRNAGNSATVELRAIDEQNGETIMTSTSNNNDRYGIEIRSNVASLTLDSTGSGNNVNVIDTNYNNNFFGYAFGNTATPVFKITGSHDLAIMAKAGVDVSDGRKLAGFSDAANIDASAFSGNLRIAGSLSNDVITGGSGAEILYGLGGADSLTGNGGADQFRLAEFYNSTDTITDFAQGVDKVGLNQFDFANTTATTEGAALLISDYVDNRSGITSIGNADAKKVIELQAALDGNQIASDSGAAVEAYVLVFNTTSGKAELWYDSNWSNSGSRSHIVTFENITNLVGVQDFSNGDFAEYVF
jgi:hypothetical protein